MKLLDSKCRNCWSNTVMFMFRSRLIGEKVERVFRNLRKNNSNMEVVMAAIVNNIVGDEFVLWTIVGIDLDSSVQYQLYPESGYGGIAEYSGRTY